MATIEWYKNIKVTKIQKNRGLSKALLNPLLVFPALYKG